MPASAAPIGHLAVFYGKAGVSRFGQLPTNGATSNDAGQRAVRDPVDRRIPSTNVLLFTSQNATIRPVNQQPIALSGDGLP